MEDHDLLIRIDERMERVEIMLDGGKETFKTHDERLRDLESGQSKIMTYIVAIGSAITIGCNAALYLLGKIWR